MKWLTKGPRVSQWESCISRLPGLLTHSQAMRAQGSKASELCILIESNLRNFPSRSAILAMARGRVLK